MDIRQRTSRKSASFIDWETGSETMARPESCSSTGWRCFQTERYSESANQKLDLETSTVMKLGQSIPPILNTLESGRKSTAWRGYCSRRAWLRSQSEQNLQSASTTIV